MKLPRFFAICGLGVTLAFSGVHSADGSTIGSTVLIDTGSFATSDSPPTWNSVTTQAPVVDLKFTDGTSSFINMTFIDEFRTMSHVNSGQGFTETSTLRPDYPWSVIRDFAILTPDTEARSTGAIQFTGLDPNLRYDLTFYGAVGGSTTNRYINVTIDGTTQTYGAGGDSGGEGLVTFHNVASDINGALTTYFTLPEGSEVGHLNAIEIHVVPEPSSLALAGLGLGAMLFRRRRV